MGKTQSDKGKSSKSIENFEKKKKKDKEGDGSKKKKKKYDPKEEEELVESLISKVYKDKKHKKKKQNIFDSESEDFAGSETGMDISASSSTEEKAKDGKHQLKEADLKEPKIEQKPQPVSLKTIDEKGKDK